LVYQTVWLREFRLIFGASTAATAAVLGLFMGGLGLGSALLGPRGDRSRKPLALYGKLEVGIALSAAISPFLLQLVQVFYDWTGGSPTIGLFFATILRLLLATVVIGAPAFLMGGTLPAAVRAVVTHADIGRRGLSLLYGVNTLGAVTGVCFSTFFLLEAFGNRQTLWLAGLLNLVVAWLAWRLDMRKPSDVEPEPAVSEGAEARQAAMPVRFVLVAAFVAGFSFFLMEVVWYRMLSPVLGGSTFTFGIILGVALLGIGLGGVAHGLLAAGKQATAFLFAITCALEALFMAIPFALGDRLAVMAGLLRSLHAFGFYGNVLGWTLTTMVVVLPAAFVAGVQFPLLISLLGRGSESVARQTGQAYAWNTAGALTGSLAGGFGLLPILTAPGAWRAVVVLLVVLAAVALVFGLRATGWKGRARAGTLTAAFCGLMALLAIGSVGPTAFWRHSPIGAGRMKLIGQTANEIEAKRRGANASVIWEAEGLESSVALESDSGLAFIVNGKNDGNAVLDRGTQIMSGLLPAMLHGDVKSACVVGLGTGSTGGWLADIPGIERVLVIELEPAMDEVAAFCAAVNRDALENPKMEAVYHDGREVLTTIDEKFDLIVSEPSNPYRAGIASLFTTEYYEACKRLLNENGIFAQWLQAYEVDAGTVKTVYKTLAGVFPKVETFTTQHGDLLLIGQIDPRPIDVDRLDALARSEPFRSAMRLTWMVEGAEGVLSRFLIGDGFARATLAAPNVETNTDDQTVLEFAFAKTVGDAARFSADQLMALARERGYDRPEVKGEVDWEKVDRLSTTSFYAQGAPLDPFDSADKTQEQAIRVHHLHGAARWDLILKAVRDRAWIPKSLMDHLILAQALIETEAPQGEAVLNGVKEAMPRESAVLQASLAMRAGRWNEAADELEALFISLRETPWIWPPMVARAFALSEQVARQANDPAVTRRLLAALDQPFAAYAYNFARWQTALELASKLPGEERAAKLQALFREREPWMIWDPVLLRVREAAYRMQGDPLAERALLDYADYVAKEPVPIEIGLPKIPTEASSKP